MGSVDGMGVMRHWPDDKPLTLYRYGTEWTSVERGYPHQDADAKVEVEPSTTTQGAVEALEHIRDIGTAPRDSMTWNLRECTARGQAMVEAAHAALRGAVGNALQ